MKFQIATSLLAAASVNALALGNIASSAIELVDDVKIALTGSVINSAAFKPFQNTRVLLKTSVTTSKRQEVVTPDNIFVLQCVDAGFREPCLVFGAPPGECGK